MTEGSLGYILQQSLLNQTAQARRVRRLRGDVVTQVMVDEHRRGVLEPEQTDRSVPDREEAERRREGSGAGASGRTRSIEGFRRLVPSPTPIKVIQRT